jgi:N-formylglutamate amidohydrolase
VDGVRALSVEADRASLRNQAAALVDKLFAFALQPEQVKAMLKKHAADVDAEPDSSSHSSSTGLTGKSDEVVSNDLTSSR